MLAAAVSRMLSSSALVRTKARLLRMSVLGIKGHWGSNRELKILWRDREGILSGIGWYKQP